VYYNSPFCQTSQLYITYLSYQLCHLALLCNNGKDVTVECERPAVLIIDDDEEICDLICEELAEKDFVCEVSFNAVDALAKLKKNSFDLALVDIILPGMSGIDLLKVVAKCYQMTAIVMITGVSDVNTAVEAMRLGASDYIIKPFNLDKLEASISTVLRNRNLQCKVYNTIPSFKDIEYDNSTESPSLSKINAIAFGVDAQVDYFDFHSKIVTDKTIELARRLGLPGVEIEKWAVARDKIYSERDKQIKSMLSKLEQNPIAQIMLGYTGSVCQFLESSNKQN
jgi:ActR/RegA family two-component response regulator